MARNDLQQEAIRTYERARPKYERLCLESKEVLRVALAEEDVQVASLTYRAKTVESFAEKINRKSYQHPLSEITDLAGVRVVCLYRSDLALVGDIINDSFKVLERIDKTDSQGIDRFGYEAIQFVAQLDAETCSGPRYDELHGLVVEIQIRSVLQDAWAIIEHHLAYKKEIEVAPILRRRLNALAAVLEIGDDAFEQIRQEIETHICKKTFGTASIAPNEQTTLENVAAFIQNLHPTITKEDSESEARDILANMNRNKFKRMSDLEAVFRKTERARQAFHKECTIWPHQRLQYALAFCDFYARRRFSGWIKSLFRKHRHLIDALPPPAPRESL